MHDIVKVLKENLHYTIMGAGVITYHTLTSWLKTRVQYSKSKKDLYAAAIKGQLKCQDTRKELSEKFKTEYEFMAKGGEQHASEDNSYVDDNGYRQGETSRPRALFAGVKYTFGLLTMFQGTMIQYLRFLFPWYIHGMTSNELSDRISK